MIFNHSYIFPKSLGSLFPQKRGKTCVGNKDKFPLKFKLTHFSSGKGGFFSNYNNICARIASDITEVNILLIDEFITLVSNLPGPYF